MSVPEPNLENLSIAELESLLAERRRRESKRMMRAIAGRGPEQATPPAGAARPAGLLGDEPRPAKGKTTHRLRAADARRELDRPPPAPAVRQLPAPPGGDRFRRTGLAAPVQVRTPRGPAWLRPVATRRTVDTLLQLAELAFVLLFVWVVAEWLFAETESDSSLAADVGADVALVGTPARSVAGRGTATVVRPKSSPSPTLRQATPTAVRTVAGKPTRADASGGKDEGAGLRWTGSEDMETPAPQAALPPGAPITTTLTGLPTPATTDEAAPEDSAEGVLSDPTLPTQIRIPKIKLTARVREVEVHLDNWEWEVADFMAGYHAGTAVPGETGNVVIAGHRDIRGKVFYNLDKLKKGDEIFLATGRGIFRYTVRKIGVVKPTDVQVMAPTTDSRLTLITCTPVKVASHRLIVIADLDTKYVAPERGP